MVTTKKKKVPEVLFQPPGKDEPGFLRRSREAIRFSHQLKTDPTVEALDAMVQFLVGYVVKPESREEATEALLDASENQFMEMLDSLRGETDEEDPTEETADAKT